MTLTELGDGLYRLSGRVDYDIAPRLRAEVDSILAARSALRLSFSGVEDGNSLLIALMIGWLRQARRRGCDLTFVEIPEGVLALIEFSGLAEVMPVESRVES